MASPQERPARRSWPLVLLALVFVAGAVYFANKAWTEPVRARPGLDVRVSDQAASTGTGDQEGR